MKRNNARTETMHTMMHTAKHTIEELRREEFGVNYLGLVAPLFGYCGTLYFILHHFSGAAVALLAVFLLFPPTAQPTAMQLLLLQLPSNMEE